MRKAFIALLARDLRLGWRQRFDILTVVLFFLAAGALFPFASSPAPDRLSAIAAGVVMTMAALASLLSLERLFGPDYEDGSLDFLAVSALPLEATALAKIAAHWLMSGLPLLMAAPALSLFLRLPAEFYPRLMVSLLLITPALSVLGCFGAALALGSRRDGLLVSFLILPLFAPILILGAGAVEQARLDLGQTEYLYLLCSIDLVAIGAGPWAIGAALRQLFH